MGYEKVQEAPPPYSNAVHEHVEYGAGPANAANAAVSSNAAATSYSPPPPLATVATTTTDDHEGKPGVAGEFLQQFGNMVFTLLGLLCLGLCFALVGLPYAKTLMRQAVLCLQPFGTEVSKPLKYKESKTDRVLNVLWAITFGWWFFMLHVILAATMFATIVFIPFGKLHWRLGVRILWPLGLVRGPTDKVVEHVVRGPYTV